MSNQAEGHYGDLSDVEQRTTRRCAVEVRSGGRLRIGGTAASFNHPSEPMPGPYGAMFIESIAPSFFNMSRGLNWPGVVARFMHRDDMILGSTRSGTLQLTVDPAVGLDYVVDLPETRKDTYDLVSRGDIAESSFSFIIVSAEGDRWSWVDGMPLRTLVSGKLLDVAPVVQGQYQGNTSVSIRSLSRFMDAPESDVTDAALAGELRRFFTRTDRPTPPMPLTDSKSRVQQRISARRRQLELMAMRWPVEHVKPMTLRQKQTELARLAVPPERRSGRSAWLETDAMRED
jgi:uncharacterized protein